MAKRYIYVDRGKHDADVRDGSSTGNKSLELVVDLAANMTRAEVIQLLQSIINFVMKSNWPPA